MIEPALVSAVESAEMLRASSLFRPPARPRLLPGLVVAPIEQGLVVEGTEERQVFRGRAATSLLPVLLPLLDGTRTAAEVAAALPGAPAGAVENALALLYARGLLEEGGPGAAPIDLDEPLAGFLARHVDLTRMNRSASAALARMRSAAVAVAGPGGVSRGLEEELARCGVPLAGRGAPLDRAALVVALAAGEEDQAALADLDSRLAARGVPWLRAALAGPRAEVGPYFGCPRQRCYRCFAATREPPGDALAAGPAEVRTWLALVAAEVVFLTSRVCPPVTARGTLVLDLEDWSQRSLFHPRLPGCATCCPGTTAAGPVEPALAYEQAIASPPPDLLDPKRHQLHFTTASRELQAMHRTHRSLALEPLGPERTSGGRLDRPALAALLRRTAGLRAAAPSVRRWAPTAGNLGSVQVSVAARRVPGLAPGLHAYAPWDDALARLDAGSPAADLDALFEPSPAAPALVVLTADLARAAAKYGPAAYHLVHLDAGAALAQLAAVAAALGLAALPVPAWDDARIAAALMADPDAEPVTAVLALAEARP